jgi:hypothetical protein
MTSAGKRGFAVLEGTAVDVNEAGLIKGAVQGVAEEEEEVGVEELIQLHQGLPAAPPFSGFVAHMPHASPKAHSS